MDSPLMENGPLLTIPQPPQAGPLPTVHDPYSFYVYSDYSGVVMTLPDAPSSRVHSPHSLSDAGSWGEGVGSSGCSSEIDDTASTTSQISLPNRRRVITPCGHDSYKRLRFKKGYSHFLCTVCSCKWKQTGV